MTVNEYLEATGFVSLNITDPMWGETFRRSVEQGFNCFAIVTIYKANGNVQITLRHDCGYDDSVYVIFRGRLETVTDFETIFKYCGI